MNQPDTSVLTFVSLAAGAEEFTSGTTFNNLRDAYQQVMKFFNLSYGKDGILLPVHFASKFSTFYASTSVKVAYYGQPILDPDISLPATGDMATNVGFVMIALAIVAASALAYRKVRN